MYIAICIYLKTCNCYSFLNGDLFWQESVWENCVENIQLTWRFPQSQVAWLVNFNRRIFFFLLFKLHIEEVGGSCERLNNECKVIYQASGKVQNRNWLSGIPVQWSIHFYTLLQCNSIDMSTYFKLSYSNNTEPVLLIQASLCIGVYLTP